MPSVNYQDHSARRFLCAHFENSVMNKSNPFLLVGVVRGCELRPAHSPLTATTTTTKTTISLRACRTRGKSGQGNELRSENEKQSKGQMLFFVVLAVGDCFRQNEAGRELQVRRVRQFDECGALSDPAGRPIPFPEVRAKGQKLDSVSMSQLVNSFDVFDTLIARRSVEPRLVLKQLEAHAGVPGLAAVRVAADQQLGSQGQPHQLADIWQEVRRVMGVDAATTDRLHQLEIQLEHDEVIPIVENLAQVRDGDVLVSDTYLPAEVVLSVLRRAGLERTVALVVSNDGKFRGWIWPKLLAKFPIRQHFGDNLHSDGKTPSAAGIKAIIYTGAKRSPIEQFLVDQGWAALANLSREVRLANPIPGSRSQERYLWNLSCELNFPLLLFASLWLERFVRDNQIREIHFVSRDCLLWHRLYQQLFPHQRATYLYASRKCLFKPSADYLDYFRSTWHPDSVIVDLFSTGISWSKLFSRLNAKAKCFFIGRVDNYSYVKDSPRPEDWLDMNQVFSTSEFGQPLNKNVEMLNYAPHPVVEDVHWLPDHGAVPMLADTLEYNQALPEAAHQSFRPCIKAMSHYPDLLKSRAKSLGELIRVFIRTICADPQLPMIYSGHHAADVAYLQSILS